MQRFAAALNCAPLDPGSRSILLVSTGATLRRVESGDDSICFFGSLPRRLSRTTARARLVAGLNSAFGND
jgi:hypothetical protein